MTASGLAMILIGWVWAKYLEPIHDPYPTYWQTCALLVLLFGVISFCTGIVIFVAKVMP